MWMRFWGMGMCMGMWTTFMFTTTTWVMSITINCWYCWSWRFWFIRCTSWRITRMMIMIIFSNTHCTINIIREFLFIFPSFFHSTMSSMMWMFFRTWRIISSWTTFTNINNCYIRLTICITTIGIGLHVRSTYSTCWLHPTTWTTK